MSRHYDYTIAQDFDQAWLNFDLNLPLLVMPDGKSNPFYVDRPGNPIAPLERGLLRPYYTPPKYFLSGHRGCGKSTELLRIAANPEVLKRFYPIHFNIQDMADINDLDFVDVLVNIAAQIYYQYRQPEAGRDLPKQVLKELKDWKDRVDSRTRMVEIGGGLELGLELDTFFGKIGPSIKLETVKRREFRDEIKKDISGLINTINLMTATMQVQIKRMPLVLIDDLDKPDLEVARRIFFDHRAQLLQPNCAVVYTVSSPLYFSVGFYDAIRESAFFLPNVRLHPKGQPAEKNVEGYRILRMFVQKRMEPDLITAEALERAIWLSGGLFRELCRVIRIGIDNAQAANRTQISLDDVRRTEVELRNEFRRILNPDQRAILKQIRADNDLAQPDQLGPLFQSLAVLEYRNGDNWCDIHPALNALLDEDEIKGEGRRQKDEEGGAVHITSHEHTD